MVAFFIFAIHHRIDILAFLFQRAQGRFALDFSGGGV